MLNMTGLRFSESTVSLPVRYPTSSLEQIEKNHRLRDRDKIVYREFPEQGHLARHPVGDAARLEA